MDVFHPLHTIRVSLSVVSSSEIQQAASGGRLLLTGSLRGMQRAGFKHAHRLSHALCLIL